MLTNRSCSSVAKLGGSAAPTAIARTAAPTQQVSGLASALRGRRLTSSSSSLGGIPLPASAAGASLARAFRSTRRSAAAVPSAIAAPASSPASATAPAPAKLHGFTLVEDQFIAEYGSRALLYRHDKTGAQVMSLINDDENKTFGAVFRTPVDNSKGTPHILEHSVLCGSRKYPIKEPFVELMKGSLNTFLNAFTYPDRTCYPVASTNLQDFYNLMDVYLDAVLHPNCIKDPKIFAQEGWHLEADDPADPLVFKGVVFNEMKGVYSSPDSVNARATQQAIFPDNTYAKDSGGDPRDIPNLTFEEFKGFYEAYYHPTNARFWFYGDDPHEERLRRLAAYLDEFEARPAESSVGKQRLFDAPRRVVETYAAGAAAEEGEAGGEPRAFVSVNWLLAEDELDLETELGLGFLNYLMLGTSAAPLRKALTDSGLGESLIGGGVEDELRQPVFSIGLKGVKEQDADKVESLVMSTLEALARDGFSAGSIEAAINTIEFSLRENNTGRFPRGLSLMLRSVAAWIYDRDPFRPMRWRDDLEHFKARLSAGEDVFGPLIRKYLLENNHRVTVELRPDDSLGERIETEERQRLDSIAAELDDGAKRAVVEEAFELRERQETPDTPEALSCVPSLSLSDIPKEASRVPTAIDTSKDGVTTLTHDLFTNDVIYMDLALDLTPVPMDLMPLVPLFCSALTQMGTEKESFIQLTERIGRKTGGLSISPFVSPVRSSKDPVAYVTVRGKAMADKAGDMLEIVRDVLLTARLDDRDRFRQMALETKSGLEAAIVGSGHAFAGTRLDAQRSTAGYVSELMGGISYLEFIRGLTSRIDSDWEGVQADLEKIRSALLQRQGAMVNLTGDEGALSATRKHLEAFWQTMPLSAVNAATGPWSGMMPPRNEALVVPTQVNYVAKAANLYEDAGYELSGSSYVITKLLSTSWLWDRVRVSGGAYGAYADFDTHSGMFTYSSYRDPNLLKTVDIYDATASHLAGLELTQEELTKGIIGTIGDIDAYQLPDAKGRTAFMRHLLGVTDEDRQRRREEVLGTSIKDFKRFGEVLAEAGKVGKVVAVTSAERAEAANKERAGFFDEIKRML